MTLSTHRTPLAKVSVVGQREALRSFKRPRLPQCHPAKRLSVEVPRRVQIATNVGPWSIPR
jgi:hypothetical protein